MESTYEKTLWRRIEDGDLTARDAMVTGHIGLVYPLARRYHRDSRVDEEELVGVGLEAVCVSVDGYRAKKPQCCFSTFATQRIKAAMIEKVRCGDGAVTRTEWAARSYKAAHRKRQKLEDALGYTPSSDDIAYVYGDKVAHTLEDVPTFVEWDTVEQTVPAHDETTDPDRLEAAYDSLPLTCRLYIDEIVAGATMGDADAALGISRAESWCLVIGAEERLGTAGLLAQVG